MYLVCWKSRAGWVGMEGNEPMDGKARLGPGAIVLPKAKGIWSEEKGRWLRYGDIPRSMKSIRKKSK
jgi:hypothetical protein